MAEKLLCLTVQSRLHHAQLGKKKGQDLAKDGWNVLQG
jgi:hypothetical protein